MNVRPATTGDLDSLRRLLASVDLPSADLSLDMGPFLLVETDGVTAACAGIELYADEGLLRSVAVIPQLRGRGIAVRLCAEVLDAAATMGVRHAYLLTTTAPGFFEKIGFSRLSRSEAPDSIRSTREFRELCPDTAVLMHKAVTAGSNARRRRDS